MLADVVDREDVRVVERRDRALDAAIVEPAQYRRLALIQGVAEKIRDDLPILPLYRQWDLYAFAKDLDFSPRLDRFVVLRDIRWLP